MKTRSRRLALAVLLAAGLAAPAAVARPFSASDLVAVDRVSDPQASPDGRWVAFVLRSTDLEANRGRTDLWLVAADGSAAPRRLTTDPASDTSPRWSPESDALYFLSTRSGSAQVWRLPLRGGEARQVTALPLDVTNFVLGPRGARLAVTMEVFPGCEDAASEARDSSALACTERLLDERADGPSGVVYDELFIRHWDHWRDGRRSHLFVVEPGAAPATSAVDVTAGLAMDVPSKPFGGAEEIAFTPDGESLVFAGRAGGSRESWSTNFDLWIAPVPDGEVAPSPPRPLTEENPAWDTQPGFSPDGRALVWLAMERPGYESDRFALKSASLLGNRLGAVREVAPEWDRSAGGFAFSRDGETLYVTAANLGQRSLFAVDVATGERRVLVEEGSVSGVSVAGDAVVIAHSDLSRPADLFRVDPASGAWTRLTRFNQERLADVEMGEAEQFTFPGWNGETVHAYVVKPPGLSPGEKAPVAFLIHGGPQGSFGNDFHYRWNPQTYAGAGYAAVMVDFHGSVGYGQAFTDAINGDWGGKPLEDLKKGLAAALERFDFLDGDRVCALGASYGGYMINWIAGAWPDRFDCLVNHDGLFDNRSMYYTTEELWFPEWDHRGAYHDNPDGHERHNPVNLVSRWETPMLVIHGALDFRVPETQGIATFTALQRRGIPSRFLYFPDENHWVLKPQNSIQWHQEVNAWLDRWLGAE